MATVSDSRGFCASCSNVITEYQGPNDTSIFSERSREDFLFAQNKCYICTWIGASLGTEALKNLSSESLETFHFFLDKDLWRPRGKVHGQRVMDVTAYGQKLTFYAAGNAEFTNEMPAARINFQDSYSSTLAKDLIKNCRDNHTRCNPIKNGFRPKRLIHIIDESHWKLVFPRHLPEEHSIDYVALSHCWGGYTRLLKLTTDNERQLQCQTRSDKLPTTFKEAISACLGLNLCYIWIDSLCIIQDSVGDWHEQAAEMDLVYGNAALSICMAASSNPLEASFSFRDPGILLPLVASLGDHHGKQTDIVMVCDEMIKDLSHSPLRERGWVFQEWYLARRSLILGRTQLWWHCCEKLACETFPREIPASELGAWTFEPTKNKRFETPQDPSDSLPLWELLIQQYAATKLTMEEKDRVIAFSGVSTVFGKAWDIGDQYMAGMWRCHFPRSLLWCNSSKHATFRSLERYKAPSWSWMSLDGPIILGDRPLSAGMRSHCCSLESVSLPLQDEGNATGRLKGGAIKIQGHLLELDIHAVAEFVEDKSTFRTLTDEIRIVFEREIYHTHFEQSLYTEIYWDEGHRGEQVWNRKQMVSYLECGGLDSSQGEPFSDFSRTRMSVRAADGSFFALPITELESCVWGLILYKPPHQSDVFHRVASYRSGPAGDFAGFRDRMTAHFPAQSICIL